MNKVSIIIKREYLTRVRKKSFIIMTILAPLLMAGFAILIPFIMMSGSKDSKKIAIIEKDSDFFKTAFKNSEDVTFKYLGDIDVRKFRQTFTDSGYYGFIYISPSLINAKKFETYTIKQPSLGLLEDISRSLEKELENKKREEIKTSIPDLDTILKQLSTQLTANTNIVDEKGDAKETSQGVAMTLAYISGLLMYMLVFMFGAQVMRGVIEEKTSRVVEVIVSSVKPVQLMMGKIIGIALVGLTQFMIWVVLTIATVGILKATVFSKTDMTQITQSVTQNIMDENQAQVPAVQDAVEISPELAEMTRVFENAMNMNWVLIIFSFIFFFITGYLLYASMFAAIGSAVDNETETQQFMLPVTLPIILALVVAMGTMQNPDSSLAFWFSIIPLTSPIVMMARIPFIVPAWQIILSMGLMVVTFIAFVWMAAKVYRTGILMYGKKSSWKEIWKWLRYTG